MADDTQVVAVEGKTLPIQPPQIPGWLDGTMVGVMVTFAIAVGWLMAKRTFGKNAADATLDQRNDAFQTRILKQLDDAQEEKAKIISRAEVKEKELYDRNKELNDRNASFVDKLVEMQKEHSTQLMASSNQMRIEMADQAKAHGDGIKRVHTVLEETKHALVRCEERDAARTAVEQETQHRLSAMERIVGVKAAVEANSSKS